MDFNVAFDVVAGTRLSEVKSRSISFWKPVGIVDKPRGAPNTDNQNAGCEWVECSRVAGLGRPYESLNAVHHVARRPACGFIYIQDTKHFTIIAIFAMDREAASGGIHFLEKVVTDESIATDYPTDLSTALRDAGIGLPDDRVELLDRYRELLWKWNEQLNLTRHTTLEKFVTRDVVDSCELANLLAQRERVLDIGTGGGVPGLILAICRPDLRISVCESVQKKAKVVESMVVELNLPVSVYACRAEEVLELQTFDALVARGVAALPKILRWVAPHWKAFDRLLLIKGRKWVDERGEARHLGLLKKLELRKAANYLTPRTDAESVILSITPREE